MITHTPRSTAQRPIASTSSGGYTAPVGLLGDTNNSAFVRGVHAASSWSTVTRKPCLRGGGQDDGHAVGERDRLRIRGPVGRGYEHLVARVEEGLERVVDRVLAAVRDDDLLRLDDVAGVAGGLGRDRGAQLGQAARRCVVLVGDVPARRDRRLDDARRRGEVGFAGTEADDVIAGRLERLRLGVDRERGRLGDGADAARDPAHAPMVARTTPHDPHDFGRLRRHDRGGIPVREIGEARIVGEDLDHRDLRGRDGAG